MSKTKENEVERRYPTQFYCNEEEQTLLRSAADKTLRSAASFAKYHTLKAAQEIAEGKAVE